MARSRAAPPTTAQPQPLNFATQDKTRVQKLLSTLGLWLGRALTAVVVIVYGGGMVAVFGVMCYAIMWGAIAILQAGVGRVVHAVEITDSATLDRNLVLGSAIAPRAGPTSATFSN
jgi:hypothetical protein